MTQQALQTPHEADQRSAGLIDACERAVVHYGGKVIYDADLLPADADGLLVPKRWGIPTIVVSDAYDDFVEVAGILAHETAHFFDPTLMRMGDRFRDEWTMNQGEAVARAGAAILLTYYGVAAFYDMAQLWDEVAYYTRRDKYFTESRAFIRRVDAAVRRVLPPEGQAWLTAHRNRPDRRPEEISLRDVTSKAVKRVANKWFGDF